MTHATLRRETATHLSPGGHRSGDPVAGPRDGDRGDGAITMYDLVAKMRILEARSTIGVLRVEK